MTQVESSIGEDFVGYEVAPAPGQTNTVIEVDGIIENIFVNFNIT